jgi:hypothetical protein
MNSGRLGKPGEALEIRNDGDASDIECVLADPCVARLGSLNVIDAGQRVFDGRPLRRRVRPAGRCWCTRSDWSKGSCG